MLDAELKKGQDLLLEYVPEDQKMVYMEKNMKRRYIEVWKEIDAAEK